MLQRVAPATPMAPWQHALLNDWQRGFPLCERPYQAIAERAGASETEVIRTFERWMDEGAISRIGGVWAAGAGGSALLCAMAVPEHRLEAVAACVSAHPGVNHNYEREHAFNLWFVITGLTADVVQDGVTQLEAATGCAALRLPMVRPYRIDLGFCLREGEQGAKSLPPAKRERVAIIDHPLAAALEDGLALTPRPFDAWSERTGLSHGEVFRKIQHWLDAGTLRRFGAVVRHHELGFAANAMVVFDVDETLVDAFGAQLAVQPGVTLCYRRAPAPGWPYTLYCMVHGRERAQTEALIAQAMAATGLDAHPHRVLFSRRRFKQQGARYFRPWPAFVMEVRHA